MIAPGALDVIVPAGDRHASKAVLDESKVFLPIAGVPVLHHVLAAIERARCTGRIFVVGDRARIERSLDDPGSPVRGHRPLVVVDQGDTLYENLWRGLRAALGPDAPPSLASEDLTPTVRDKTILVITGDTPALVPEEIDELVGASDLARFDYVLGVCSEATLRAYYPRAGRPGIEMMYFDVRDLGWRQSNLNLLRPFRLGGRSHVEYLYEIRYLQDWANTAKLCVWLWRNRFVTPATVRAFVAMQLARVWRRAGVLRSPLVRPLLLELPRMEAVVSALMRTRFTTVETHYGGGALDVDDADAYEAIRVNFDAWRGHQAALATRLPPGPGRSDRSRPASSA